MTTLTIPDYDPDDPQPYPGDIRPNEYSINELVELLRQHAHDPEAILLIFDMLEK